MSASPALPSADARVQDYLNDKFQALADLSTLDTLLTSVQTQQDQLRSQLSTAESTLTSAQDALNIHQVKLSTARTSFDSRQSNINRRLQATTSAPTAAEAASHLSASLEKLRRLDIASSYIAILQAVQSLADDTRAHIDRADPRAALEPYGKLQHLSKGLRERDEAQDGVVVHLVDYVEKTEKGLWEEMKTPLVKAVDEVLKRIGWPKEGVKMDKETQAEFTGRFEKLLVLQMGGMGEAEGGPLIAMEVLVRSLGIRFRALFEGEKPTNKIDKPEWFLSHLASQVDAYEDFLNTYIQPIFRSSPDPRLCTRTATTEFITALLPLLRRKLTTILPHIRDEPTLLSHLIHELIKFDASLRAAWSYHPHGSRGIWKGITHEILVEQGGFDTWLRAEQAFALTRYDALISSADAFTLTPTPHPTTHPIPTPSATALAALSSTIATTYTPLISFTHRLRFLTDITLTLLDRYHTRLAAALSAFRALSRSPPDTNPLASPARVYCSAHTTEQWLRDAGDSTFFLELWEDLCARAPAPADPDAALFDETRANFRALRERAQSLMVDAASSHLLALLKPYARIAGWTAAAAAQEDFAPSLELLAPRAAVAELVGFLVRTVGALAARRVWRGVEAALVGFFVDAVVMRNQFSWAGARQLRGDVEELWGAARAAGVRIEPGLPARLRDVVGLLTVESEVLRAGVAEVFADAGKARVWLEGLGFAGLSVGEARGIIQRRVEAWA